MIFPLKEILEKSLSLDLCLSLSPCLQGERESNHEIQIRSKFYVPSIF